MKKKMHRNMLLGFFFVIGFFASIHCLGDEPNIKSAAGRPITIEVDPDSPISEDIFVLTYFHLDGSIEKLGRTWRYNCHGFTFFPRRYRVSLGVNYILEDNCIEVPDGEVRPGDIVAYYNKSTPNSGTSHTGRVWLVDDAGHAWFVRSHHFETAEWIHYIANAWIMRAFGNEWKFFRKTAPFKGIPDVWMKDGWADTGEQYGTEYYWGSPDIRVDVPEYDGVPDENPAFNEKNRVWVNLRNRGDVIAEGFYVKYYWADPSIGLDYSDWHPIPSTPEHPNPVGPLVIGGGSQIPAPYVEWTPEAAPAHQCLLAIAYVTDNPKDVNDPDPIVYPFQVPWDNNITQRNVTVVHLMPGEVFRGEIVSGIPYPWETKMMGHIFGILTKKSASDFFSRWFPLHPLRKPSKHKAPAVSIGVDDREYDLKKWGSFMDSSPGRIPCLNESPEWKHPAAGIKLENVAFYQGRKKKIRVTIKAPDNTGLNDTYYLHLVQRINFDTTGGYTVIINPRETRPQRLENP